MSAPLALSDNRAFSNKRTVENVCGLGYFEEYLKLQVVGVAASTSFSNDKYFVFFVLGMAYVLFALQICSTA